MIPLEVTMDLGLLRQVSAIFKKLTKKPYKLEVLSIELAPLGMMILISESHIYF